MLLRFNAACLAFAGPVALLCIASAFFLLAVLPFLILFGVIP